MCLIKSHATIERKRCWLLLEACSGCRSNPRPSVTHESPRQHHHQRKQKSLLARALSLPGLYHRLKVALYTPLTSQAKNASLLRNVNSGSGSRCKKYTSAVATACGDTPSAPLPPDFSSSPVPSPPPVRRDTSHAGDEDEEPLLILLPPLLPGRVLDLSRLLTTLTSSVSSASRRNRPGLLRQPSSESACRWQFGRVEEEAGVGAAGTKNKIDDAKRFHTCVPIRIHADYRFAGRCY